MLKGAGPLWESNSASDYSTLEVFDFQQCQISQGLQNQRSKELICFPERLFEDRDLLANAGQGQGCQASRQSIQ